MNGTALLSEARRLDGEARSHKGAIARHKQALRDVRAKQAELERQCAALGIAVVYEPTTNLTGEGNTPWPIHSSTSRR